MRAAWIMLLLVGSLRATVPQAPRETWESPTPTTRPDRPQGTRELPPPLGPFNWLREYSQISDFLADWQVRQTGHPQYGGMIEAEAGPLGGVIQTDNTLEAIWVWSRWRSWTGSGRYDANVAAAWVYCVNHPAWLEEGGTGDNYYRAHNCAWGLAACLEFEAATGDTTRRAYGRTCATYIAQHPLPLGSSLNALVTGWCAGSLYEYAVATQRDDLRAAALEQGLDLLDFVDSDPAHWLAWDEWAMSGGTMLWGLCRSVFTEAPLYGQQWLQQRVFDVPDWADWHNVDGYDWDGSWNVAYANGLFAVQDAVGDPVSAERARSITEGLLSLDTDDDGGIRAESEDPDTEDMSWVSCYLARFCLARLVGSVPQRDAGTLRLHGLLDEDVVVQGQPIPLRIVVANHGVQDLEDFPVVLEGDGGSLVAVATLAAASVDTLDFGEWTPATPGRHRLRTWSQLPQDENSRNDTLTVDLVALAPPLASPRATDESGMLRAREHDGLLELIAARPAVARIEVYNLLGQRLGLYQEEMPGGSWLRTRWQDRCPGLADGLYLLRVEAGGQEQVLRTRVLH